MATKKEMKEQYKRMKFPMGVFQIRNIANGKIFIGSSMNLDAIWNRHKFQLTMGGHANKELQDDWNKLGEDNFEFEILEALKESEDPAIDNKKEVEILEEMIIEKLQPFEEKGYNKRKEVRS
jgi:group I intron endonuclease